LEAHLPLSVWKPNGTVTIKSLLPDFEGIEKFLQWKFGEECEDKDVDNKVAEMPSARSVVYIIQYLMIEHR